MSFKVIATSQFEKKLKRLSKKYKSLPDDLAPIIKKLAQDPALGVPIGKNCYKIRIAISSKSKGKSGGGRMITYVRIHRNIVFLMDIFDKSEQANISDKELQMLIDILSDD
jgi:mRNA-degrading endonuclease RelE of RelBE toxin-antitoxin system